MIKNWITHANSKKKKLNMEYFNILHEYIKIKISNYMLIFGRKIPLKKSKFFLGSFYISSIDFWLVLHAN